MTRAWLVAYLVLGTQASAQTDSARTWGRRYTDWFFNDQLTELYARFAPKIHDAADSAKLVALRETVRSQLGNKQYVVSETITPRAGLAVYEQSVTVEKIAQVVIVRWGLDSSGRIGGFVVLPSPQTEAVSAFLDYQTRTPLRLPFIGTWRVLWGGRTLAQNPYAASPDQRFAYDFVPSAGGQSVIAPGEGTVADVVDSASALGSYVVIDHGNGEFSFLAHLQTGSVVVVRGQHVSPGAAIGRCDGHLHYHVQSTPSFMVGAGMPAQFEHYVADGKPVDRGEPTRGQVIHAAP
jgi:murein DD-endopeptidase MepM/ murein hydrolase activator NlpD